MMIYESFGATLLFLPYSWSMSFIFFINAIYIIVYIHVIAIFVIIHKVSLLFHFSYSNPLFRVYCLNLLFNIRCLEPLFNIRFLESHVLIVNTSYMLRLYPWDPSFKFMNIFEPHVPIKLFLCYMPNNLVFRTSCPYISWILIYFIFSVCRKMTKLSKLEFALDISGIGCHSTQCF
jgi:hypothetical protein